MILVALNVGELLRKVWRLDLLKQDLSLHVVGIDNSCFKLVQRGKGLFKVTLKLLQIPFWFLL